MVIFVMLSKKRTKVLKFHSLKKRVKPISRQRQR